MQTKTKNDKIYFGNLLAFYDSFLTKKQVEYMNLYYLEDYSLQEIADIYDVTRMAIHNQLQSAQKKLIDFEDHLHLFEISAEIIPALEKGYENKEWQVINESIEKFKKLI